MTTRRTPSTTCASATLPRCCAATCPRATRSGATPTRSTADDDLAAQPLTGYLTGSIDVVLRVDVDGRTRYLTVDYKTNWLGDLDAPLTAHDYRPAVLDEAMGHSDYPLQALLYAVVLHRYLRWRLPDYDPATHLGGVLYLYLRGMCGPDTPRVDGLRRAGSSRGGPRSRSSRSCPTCWTDGWWPMSDVFEPVDLHDRDLALADGRRSWPPSTRAGVLTAADVHVATNLGRLGGEADASVLLAIALAVRAVRHGSVCLDLATVPDPLADLTSPGPSRPSGRRQSLASPLLAAGVRALGARAALPRPLPRAGDPGPRRPAVAPGRRPRSIDPDLLDAVPGARLPRRRLPTSSGTPAARAAAQCDDRHHRRSRAPARPRPSRGCWSPCIEQAEPRGETLRIALAAPTGKAAARLEQSVRDSATRFGAVDRARLAGVRAMTLHRLLRPHPGNSTRFRHHRGNRLPHDVVVVDEASMVSLTMMARAARGGAARGPAGAGRRPRPALARSTPAPC